ncbi:CubicO group peptidase (beta-lactamase class C family) [Neorhizobium galegae]|uniref:serine hydrolase domain-containing protein n=1 Tax=Neorhizobium galegae TaxID=399 RepID=UPI001AE334CD|nr:serine hydrolase [Neorhizobium galegae]MBP2549016.1 CubicO group peptidase (beta-lactamase class C family) [Neorhizobium galegae]
MRLVLRLVRFFLVFVVLVLIACLVWLYVAPPALLRVGSGYAAKIVCSNVFLAGRESAEVLSEDVQAPGHPLLRLMRVAVDRDAGRVHAAILGAIAPATAVYREGFGCTLLADGKTPASLPTAAASAEAPAKAPVDTKALWPEGETVVTRPDIGDILSRDDLTGPGLRAVVVVKDDRIVGERYGQGFDARMPLLGWSMTKTVNAALIATMIRDGRMTLADKGLFGAWKGDERADITLAQLLAMESGLAFNEDYGAVADVTRMLFLEPDMAGFAASLPLARTSGTGFHYSSGTAMLLSRLWMDRFTEKAEALAYPHKALFEPLGMASAVMELDETGTFAGSSYMYATARDWARFGLLLAKRGEWQGRSILPPHLVEDMWQENATSGGRYSRMQTWLARQRTGEGAFRAVVPQDQFALEGHDGQSVTVIPSRGLVVVRLGLTPAAKGYRSDALAAALLQAL